MWGGSSTLVRVAIRAYHATRCSYKGHHFTCAHPTTNGGTQKWRLSWNGHVFSAADLHAQSALVSEISAPEPAAGSLLRVRCWLGSSSLIMPCVCWSTRALFFL